MRKLSVAQLFEDNRSKLSLTWVSGRRDAVIADLGDGAFPADLVGHLNPIHSGRVQVLGAPEIAWSEQRDHNVSRHMLGEIFDAHPPAVVVADGCDVPGLVRTHCEQHDVPLITTIFPVAAVIDHLRLYLARTLAEQTTVHGVFMDVLGMGVLITGDSGVGKSELALELISRGHGLVADDIVEVSRVAPTLLEGRSPDMLRDFLEVRGLGVLNIRTVFGETACRRKMKLRLMVYLQKPVPGIPEATRLPLDNESVEILSVRVRKVVIPVAAGRNLAVLVEAAVRTTILQYRGVDSTLEFVERQRLALDSSGDE